MNLEKLNLVELNAQEVKSVDGGAWWTSAIYHAMNMPRYGWQALTGAASVFVGVQQNQ